MKPANHGVAAPARARPRRTPSAGVAAYASPSHGTEARRSEAEERRADRRPRWRLASWLALAVGVGLTAAFYLSWPFTGDQGIFAWVASRIVDGGLPYRDAWDTKGPAAYYLSAPAVVLFGRTQWGFRLYDLLWLSAGVAAVGALARAVSRRAGATTANVRAAGLTAAALLALWYLSLDPYNTAQPDGWAAMALALGAAVLVRDGERTRVASAAAASAALPSSSPARGAWRTLGAAALFGVCVGVATLVKPTYGVYGFIALVYLASVTRDAGRPWRSLAAPYAALLAGFVAVLGGCAAWFAAHGALGDLIDVYLRFGPMVYARTNADPVLVRLRFMEQFVVDRFGVALPLVVAAAVWLRRRARAEGALLLTWLLCVFANVLTQGRDLSFPYRWLSLYPPLAILTALGVLGLRELLRDGSRGAARDREGRVVAAIGATVIAVSAFTPAYYAYRWVKYAVGRTDSAHYYATELGPEYGWYGGPKSMSAIVDYVRARTAPDDAVLVWDSQPGVNFLAGRRSPVRFAWSGALTYGAAGDGSGLFRDAYRREYLASLASDPPRYVVALDDATCAHHSDQSLWCLKSFPALRAYVAEHYVRETNIYSHDVFRRVR